MKIVVLGAGAWGTALAVSAAAHAGGNAVTLWARDEQQAAAMQAARCNQRYLPGLAFAPALQVVAGDARALAASAELIVIGTPMAALRGMPVDTLIRATTDNFLRLFPCSRTRVES